MMKKIEVKVYSFIDGDGNTVYDFESMAEEFEDRLSELDKNLLVMCSIDEIGTADRNNELSRNGRIKSETIYFKSKGRWNYSISITKLK